MFAGEMAEMSLLERVSAQCNTNSAAAQPVEPTVTDREWTVPGFGAGARVATSFGLVPVELLRRRDEIRTKDGRILRVQHVDVIRLERRFLLTHPNAQPIIFHKGSLGGDFPNETMFVSGGQKLRAPHRYDLTSGIKAISYVGQRNIAPNFQGNFTYHVFHCGESCTVNVNGIWVDLDPADFVPIQE